MSEWVSDGSCCIYITIYEVSVYFIESSRLEVVSILFSLSQSWILVRKDSAPNPSCSFLKNTVLPPTPSHSSDPSPREKHQTNSVIGTSKSNQAHIVPPRAFQNLSSNRNTYQSPNAHTRETRRKVSAVILGSAQLAGADGTESDVASGREAEEEGEGYD